MKSKNYEIVVSVLSQFPLKENISITPNQSLSNIINLFGSLLSERVKAKLIEQFPSNDFSNLSSDTTIKEICSIANSKGIPVVVDNTFCTALIQNPLKLGAKISLIRSFLKLASKAYSESG